MNDEVKVASAQKKGGIARAQSLSPERKKEIAKRAAEVRWASTLPRAIAEGVLVIGDLHIPCAVLDDKDSTRVLTQVSIHARHC